MKEEKTDLQKMFEAYIAQHRKTVPIIFTNSGRVKGRLLKVNPDLKVELVDLGKLIKNGQKGFPVVLDEAAQYYGIYDKGELKKDG